MFRLTFARRAGIALAAGLLVAAAQAQPADRARPAAAALVERATSGLDLSADQQSALAALADRTADPEPGALWGLAADVEAVLTDAQVAQLREAQEARRSEHREGRAERGDRPRRGDRMRGRRGGPRGPRGGGERARLTDEQRAAVRDIAEEVRPRAEALVEQLRAGALSDDQFVAEARALRAEAASRLGAALPAEHAERMSAVRERHEAVKAAREEALGLTDAQKEAYQALALDRLREAPERPDMRPYLDEDGRLDRRAFREAMRERREAMRPQREAAREQAAGILTDDQKDIMTVHRALAGRAMRHAMRGPRGGLGRMLGPLGRID